MERQITDIVRETKKLLRFYCECGRMAISTSQHIGETWECPRCHKKRKIPATSEMEMKLDLREIPGEFEQEEENVAWEVKRWGRMLKQRLIADNLGVGAVEIGEFYCLKISMSEDITEYLKITSIESQETHYIWLSTDIGVLREPEQAVAILNYTTQYGVPQLEDGVVHLRWLLPFEYLTIELLYEVCLSLIFHASIIKRSILEKSL